MSTRDHEPELLAGEASQAEIDGVAGVLRTTRTTPDEAAFARQTDDVMGEIFALERARAAPDAPAAATIQDGWWSEFVEGLRERWHEMTRVQAGAWAVAALALLVGVGFLVAQSSTSDAPDAGPEREGVEVAETAPTTAPDPAPAPLPDAVDEDEVMVAEDDLDDLDPEGEQLDDDDLDTASASALSLAELETESLELLASEDFLTEGETEGETVDAEDDMFLDDLDNDELSVLVASLDDDPFFNP